MLKEGNAEKENLLESFRASAKLQEVNIEEKQKIIEDLEAKTQAYKQLTERSLSPRGSGSRLLRVVRSGRARSRASSSAHVPPRLPESLRAP
mmetsp:Transcript_26738/g.42981  ORF Transcript_26738/g.42981 Transcript_26738/m.42981 type:complete len:92 (-) Transcript_26738:73-348(-)